MWQEHAEALRLGFGIELEINEHAMNIMERGAGSVAGGRVSTSGLGDRYPNR